MMHVDTTIHEHQLYPPDVPVLGQWIPTGRRTDDNPQGLELVWRYNDGREVSDRELRQWCYLNLDGYWRYMDVARAYHLNSWAAAHAVDKYEEALGHLKSLLVYITDGHHSDFWREFHESREFLKRVGEL